MAKKDNTILYVAGAAALYFLFIKPKTPAAAPVTATIPGGAIAVPAVPTNPLASILNAVTSVAKNLGAGTPAVSQTFTPAPVIPEPVQALPTLALSEQIAVSPTADIVDDYTRNQVNSDYYAQYEQSFISGLHNDGYMR